jgi:gliding motility-associated-like protein
MRKLLLLSILITIVLAPMGLRAQTLPPTAQDQIVCINSSATLVASSSQAGATFTWWDAPTSGNLLGSGASFTTPLLSTGSVYYVQAELNGVSSQRTSVATSVVNIPTVGVSMDTIYGCSGESVALSGTIKQNIGQFQWYDAATGGNLIFSGNPYVLPVPSGTTQYYVQGNVGNCVNPNRAVVTVINVDAVITPTITTTSYNTCFGQPVTLTGTSNVPGYEVQWWTSAVGGSLIGVGSSVTFTPQNSQTVYADIELRNTVCQNTPRVPIQITVTQQLLSATNLSCSNTTPTSITFSWSPVAGATGYEVSSDAGVTWVAANAPPTSHTLTGLSQGTSYTLRVRALDGTTGCPPGKETQDKTCTTVDCGSINASIDPNYFLCQGESVTLVISGMISGVHQVIFNGQTTDQNQFEVSPNADTTYSFVVFNALYPSCDSAFLSTDVDVLSNPEASPTATAQDSAVPGATVNTYLFESNSTNVATWNWDFGDGSNATTENATHEYMNPGSYTVVLTITSPDGCTRSYTLQADVEVFEVPEIFVPNSFSPNGDNNNDVFFIYGEYVVLENLRIFNQYGDVVFETSDITQGWDGSWKGVDQPSGVYVYTARLRDALDNIYDRQGTLTLIR